MNIRILRLFSFRGRVTRSQFFLGASFAGLAFVVLFVFLDTLLNRAATWILYPPFFWTILALTVKRLRDRAQSPFWIAVVIIPLLGPIWLFCVLVFGKGTVGENQFGPDPRQAGADYLAVDISNPGPAK